MDDEYDDYFDRLEAGLKSVLTESNFADIEAMKVIIEAGSDLRPFKHPDFDPSEDFIWTDDFYIFKIVDGVIAAPERGSFEDPHMLLLDEDWKARYFWISYEPSSLAFNCIVRLTDDYRRCFKLRLPFLPGKRLALWRVSARFELLHGGMNNRFQASILRFLNTSNARPS